MLKRIFCCVVILVFSVPALATSQDAYEEALAGWSRTLEKFVDAEGRTDFKALAQDSSSDLQSFVRFIESTSPTSHPDLFPSDGDVMAYHLNAYNALAMYGVIDEGIPKDFDSFFKRLGFFKLRSVIIGNKKTSLHGYENNVIRPLGEPRAHFALNCMVRDCPRLPMEPFLAATLDQQLEAAAVEFFSKPLHLRLDTGKRTVYVSEILKFYTEDFVPSGKKKDLPQYLNRYLETPIPDDYHVKYIDYDWTINQQP